MAAAFAEVARVLQAEETAQRTLQKIVDLAAQMIPGCEEAGVSLVRGQRIETPAASGELPGQVDRLQYESGEGPCLDAIRSRDVFVTDDLTREQRWPHFAAAAAAETGVHSMLSFRLFVEHDTLGALNLYSRSTTAFDADSHAVGAVLAAHAAVALASAAEHDKAERLQQELAASEHSIFTYQQQVEVALTLQRSMLAALPQVPGCQLAARYTPAIAAAEVGGDWYDAFALPGGGLALTVGDVAGHDVHAAVGMSQLRNQLRALAVDRQEPPADLLRRLDRIATHLRVTDTATCVYAVLDQPSDRPARLRFAIAGHPPPLLVTTEGVARYLDTPDHVLLGLDLDVDRSSTDVDLPAGSTLLLYTDGLVEHRDRSLDEGLTRLHETAAALAHEPLEQMCDALLARLAARPEDDICLLALRLP
jgi:serine phosphatase RsbU (regulator of sigma subunit)